MITQSSHSPQALLPTLGAGPGCCRLEASSVTRRRDICGGREPASQKQPLCGAQPGADTAPQGIKALGWGRREGVGTVLLLGMGRRCRRRLLGSLQSAEGSVPRRCALCHRSCGQAGWVAHPPEPGACSRRAELAAAAAPGSCSRHVSSTGTFFQPGSQQYPLLSLRHVLVTILFSSPHPLCPRKAAVWPPLHPRDRGVG